MDEDVEQQNTSRRTSPRFNAGSAKRTKAVSTSNLKSTKCKSTGAKNCGPKKAKASSTIVHRVVGYRCAPHIVPVIIKRLDDRQKGWILDIGFEPANSMSECRLPKGLTMWLIHQVDCPRKSLVINGIPYPIKDHIQDILGFSNGNIPVPLPRSGRSKSKPFKGKKEFRSEAAGRGIKLADAIDELVKIQDKQEFCRQFTMVFLCCFLAPTSGHILNRNYMDMFNNSDHIKQMNWPEFAVDYLIQGIEDFNNSTVTNVNIHGCVGILPLIYIYIAKSPSIPVPQSTPRICSITTSLLYQLDSNDTMPGSTSQNPKYGKLLQQGSIQDDFMTDVETNHSLSGELEHDNSIKVDITHCVSTSSGQTSRFQEQDVQLLKLSLTNS